MTQIPNASPRLYNEDLAPAVERNWGAFSIFNVWTSDVHSLWGYYLAASLFLICGNFFNFIVAIGVGSLVIFFLMNLVGYAGVTTGVPYPVLARVSFGTFGANLPPPWCARSSHASGMARRPARPRARSWLCSPAATRSPRLTNHRICSAIRRSRPSRSSSSGPCSS